MKDEILQSRRSFLRNAGISSGVAAVAATLPGTVAATVEPEEKAETTEEGYQLSQHILDYYKSAAC